MSDCTIHCPAAVAQEPLDAGAPALPANEAQPDWALLGAPVVAELGEAAAGAALEGAATATAAGGVATGAGATLMAGECAGGLVLGSGLVALAAVPVAIYYLLRDDRPAAARANTSTSNADIDSGVPELPAHPALPPANTDYVKTLERQIREGPHTEPGGDPGALQRHAIRRHQDLTGDGGVRADAGRPEIGSGLDAGLVDVGPSTETTFPEVANDNADYAETLRRDIVDSRFILPSEGGAEFQLHAIRRHMDVTRDAGAGTR